MGTTDTPPDLPTMLSSLYLARESVFEVLWPTRCVCCDTPGSLVCDACKRRLPYLDQWRCCPLCGAPYGITQCTECNKFSLGLLQHKSVPFSSCRSAFFLSEGAERIVLSYKDAGEQRLARIIAWYMCCAIPPHWMTDNPVLGYIPATKAAQRRRGFDHMKCVAQECGKLLHIPTASVLIPPRNKDQRTLKRRDRMSNMSGSFCASEQASSYSHVILIDDVMTTGATMFAASDSLLLAGVSRIEALTFARRY